MNAMRGIRFFFLLTTLFFHQMCVIFFFLSILDAISNNYSESSGEQTNLDEPQQKKQKREKGKSF